VKVWGTRGNRATFDAKRLVVPFTTPQQKTSRCLTGLGATVNGITSDDEHGWNMSSGKNADNDLLARLNALKKSTIELDTHT
jgi:hypothetical protein